ncbi:heat shock factor protein 4-like isoform X2 [Physella acuta]|uniref:heat shock factor protein 4-like isoform X2 n=1 Tax=Physella acuta TaxID=109671 RepID=UPI0027DAC364|nr:heat shock factor protein 4-like isoform X2 [Physella acuta]
MYSAVENNAGNVPAFLIKLWTLVEDPSTDELIHWDSSGTSFHVYDQQRFSREILPLYFKHNNIASFVRQLNMYGFRKVTHIDQGGLKIEKDDLEFSHQFFQRGEQDMLQYIKRKVSNPAVRTTDHLAPSKTDEVSRVLADMKQVKTKQDSMDQNLEYIKRENKLLWREVAMLRQKHHKQQQIVNKLIQFLVSLVSSNRTGLTIPTIRRVPLAINDVSQLARQESAGEQTFNDQDLKDASQSLHIDSSPSHSINKDDQFGDEAYTIESPKIGDYLIPSTPSSTGPIIHELTDNTQTILVPASAVTLVKQDENSDDFLQSILSNEQAINPTPAVANRNISRLSQSPPLLSQPIPTVMVGQPDGANFLLSPKIEAAPSLEDALNFGLNVAASSSDSLGSTSQQTNAGSQKRKRKIATLPPVNTKKANTNQNNIDPAKGNISQDQAATLKNLVMANSDLNSTAPEQSYTGATTSDASLALAASKDTDDFTLSSDQLDLLSSDLDGLKGILQDQYKVDPTFLMELFDSSNPWPLSSEKDFDDLRGDQDRDEAGTSGNGNITDIKLRH